MKRIVFVAYGAGHISMLIPVIQYLQQHATVEMIVIGLTTAREKLEPAGIPYLGYADLAKNLGNYSDICLIGEHLAAALPPGSVPWQESVAYLGTNYVELVASVGEEAAALRYQAEGRHAFLPVNFMLSVLEKYQPDLVVATNSPRTERAAILAAGELEIPALCLVDLFARQEKQWVGAPGYADRVCVLTAGVRDALVENGRSAADIVITGNPAFDSLTSPLVAQTRESVRREHGWAVTDKVVLFASQVEPLVHPFDPDLLGNPALPRQIEHALFDVLEKHTDYQLILRRHPSETVIDTEIPPRVQIGDKSENLAMLLHAVDVVVVTASTVGLEAALINQPVIAVDLSIFTADAPYSSMGIALGVSALDDLESALICALSGGAPSGAVNTDGKATERVAAEVMKLLTSLDY